MDEVMDLESRLRQSLRILRAWRWMVQVSQNLDEVIAILTEEARDLIELGRLYPASARKIGKLIVAYHNMIVQVKMAAAREAEDRQRIAA